MSNRAFNSFSDLVKNGQHPDAPSLPAESTENFDAVVPPAPAPQLGNNPPNIPKWGQDLSGRVAKLEKSIGVIQQNMTAMQQNMATKQDLQGFATKQEMQAGFQRLEQLISQRLR